MTVQHLHVPELDERWCDFAQREATTRDGFCEFCGATDHEPLFPPCATCGGATDVDTAVVHWATPFSATQVAMTCSDECAARWNAAHRDEHGRYITPRQREHQRRVQQLQDRRRPVENKEADPQWL